MVHKAVLDQATYKWFKSLKHYIYPLAKVLEILEEWIPKVIRKVLYFHIQPYSLATTIKN